MIQRHEVLNKIAEILNEVNAQFHTLQQFDTDVNVEILNAKVAYLANFTEILRKISVIEKIEGSIEYAMSDRKKIVEMSIVENKFKTSDKVEEPQIEVDKNENLEIPEPFLIIKDATSENITNNTAESSVEETVIEKKEVKEIERDEMQAEFVEIEKNQKNDLQVSSTQVELPLNTIGASNIDEKSNSLNDLFAQKKDATQTISTASRVAVPIIDLRMAFSLNDRILFIRELFKGYNLAFSETIDVLNNFKSFSEAKSYLEKNYSEKNEWEKKEIVLEQFYDIIRKKYNS